eukprot:scaffold950_cov360-Pavlova_lutheri.AAC.36
MAECSLSAGRILTSCSAAKGRTAGPPAMRVSLFAKQMSFPFRMAATVGRRPAHPTIPVTTACASACSATATAPSIPCITSGRATPGPRRSRSASTS